MRVQSTRLGGRGTPQAPRRGAQKPAPGLQGRRGRCPWGHVGGRTGGAAARAGAHRCVTHPGTCRPAAPGPGPAAHRALRKHLRVDSSEPSLPPSTRMKAAGAQEATKRSVPRPCPGKHRETPRPGASQGQKHLGATEKDSAALTLAKPAAGSLAGRRGRQVRTEAAAVPAGGAITRRLRNRAPSPGVPGVPAGGLATCDSQQPVSGLGPGAGGAAGRRLCGEGLRRV